MSYLTPFNARLSSIVWCGKDFAGALADTDYITVTRANDDKTFKNSHDGENTAVSIIPSQSADIVIQTMAQSDLNSYLAAIAADERATGVPIFGGMNVITEGSVFPYLLQDVMLKRSPDLSLSQDMVESVRSWTFYCPKIVEKSLAEQTLRGDVSGGVSGGVSGDVKGGIQLSVDFSLEFNRTITL